MNHLGKISKLKNRYYALRHGKSLANEKKLIISSPEEGLKMYGLSNSGKEEVIKSVREAIGDNLLGTSTIILSSDFLRSLETAEIAKKIIGAKKITLSQNLRERYFGNWDKTNNCNYQKAWDKDINDPNSKVQGVETTSEVLKRTTSLIEKLENKYSGKKILLVSHGDPLQILQTAFEKIPPSHHRQIEALNTGEIRELVMK